MGHKPHLFSQTAFKITSLSSEKEITSIGKFRFKITLVADSVSSSGGIIVELGVLFGTLVTTSAVLSFFRKRLYNNNATNPKTTAVGHKSSGNSAKMLIR